MYEFIQYLLRNILGWDDLMLTLKNLLVRQSSALLVVFFKRSEIQRGGGVRRPRGAWIEEPLRGHESVQKMEGTGW